MFIVWKTNIAKTLVLLKTHISEIPIAYFTKIRKSVLKFI